MSENLIPFTRGQERISGYLKKAALPLFFCAVYFLWRLGILAFIHPQYVSQDYEELYRPTLAREIHALSLPLLWNFRPDDYAGGFYVVTLIQTLIQKVFGYTLFSVKVLGLLQNTGAFLLWYLTLARFVSTRSAKIFFGLFCFVSARYVLLSCMVLGDHAETVFLSALTVYLLFHAMESVSPKKEAMLLALGLLIGFGVWFAYIYAITASAVFLYLLIRYRSLWKTSWGLLLSAGALIGFSIWLYSQFKTHGLGLYIHGHFVGDLFNPQNFNVGKNFFLIRLFKRTAASEVPSVLFWIKSGIYEISVVAAAFVTVVFKLWKRIRKTPHSAKLPGPTLLCVLYCVLFAVIQQVFEPVGLRYLLPLLPFLLALISITLADLWSPRPVLSGMLQGAMIVSALLFTLPRLSGMHFGDYLFNKGYAMRTLAAARFHAEDVIARKFDKSFDSMRPSDQVGVVIGYAEQVLNYRLTMEDKTLPGVDQVPAAYRTFYAYYSGRLIALRFQESSQAINYILSVTENEVEYQSYMLRGFRDIALRNDLDVNPDFIKKRIPLPHRALFQVIEGKRYVYDHFNSYQLSAAHVRDLKMRAVGLNAEERAAFFRGVARALFKLWSADKERKEFAFNTLTMFNLEDQNAIFEGMAYRLIFNYVGYPRSEFEWKWDELTDRASAENKRQLVDGMKTMMNHLGLSSRALKYTIWARIGPYW